MDLKGLLVVWAIGWLWLLHRQVAFTDYLIGDWDMAYSKCYFFSESPLYFDPLIIQTKKIL